MFFSLCSLQGRCYNPACWFMYLFFNCPVKLMASLDHTFLVHNKDSSMFPLIEFCTVLFPELLCGAEVQVSLCCCSVRKMARFWTPIEVCLRKIIVTETAFILNRY
ncbi:hypothetical protein CRM22_003254 [Opisthorchis felineus]|uniref:Uncharacterized protein n=1 Tax=Opisthorchis felineus TaxID=147828 RepID=A0A4S2M2R1_OPIFE|nr:hypothetical protein CRM22_003254 [Opisthorchis felineus]